MIQLTLEDGLSEAGYEVVLESNGTAAMKRLESEIGRFGAVLTDIRLGDGPDGWGVGHRTRELNPAMPIVYMTGDSASEWAANGVPNSLLLQKPFVIAQLVTAVSQLITQAGMSATTV